MGEKMIESVTSLGHNVHDVGHNHHFFHHLHDAKASDLSNPSALRRSEGVTKPHSTDEDYFSPSNRLHSSGPLHTPPHARVRRSSSLSALVI